MADNTVVVFGTSLTSSRPVQFYLLACGSLACALGFSAIQERILRIDGFEYAGWMTFWTHITYASCGFTEWLVLRGGERRGTAKRKRHSVAEYGAVLMLMAGVATFVLGDRDASPAFNAAGVVLLSLAPLCDAVTANLEEAKFFRVDKPCSQAEVVACLCSCAALYSLVILIATDRTDDQKQQCGQNQQHPGYHCFLYSQSYMASTDLWRRTMA
ncbi:hypothetical protein WJX72_011608 [[Myrmecia] bisecta]|uniref:Uncharacterized protein n=1 Tax=[Myrmecia] bisecta TaxID=41462 RepID=A0AAW1RA27_9CHLO